MASLLVCEINADINLGNIYIDQDILTQYVNNEINNY